jgi:hypothetical protein
LEQVARIILQARTTTHATSGQHETDSISDRPDAA